MEITQIYANLYTADKDLSAFVNTGSDTRITIISQDGAVLADSRPLDLETVENHLTRPEIRAAASGNPAAFVRYSDTLGTDLIYYALKIENGNNYIFIRAAIPVAEINAYLFRSLPLLILILLILALLCFIFIRGMVNRITKPFSSIEQKLRLLSNREYKTEPITESYEEINRITREIDEISLVLQNSFKSLRDEKNKLNYILNNISDGIFVVDEDKNIVLINNAVLDIFDVTFEIIGKDIIYLSNDTSLVKAVNDCVKTADITIFETIFSGKIYLTTVKRLSDTKLTMTVLSDVTENRENAKRREEFFANASHELKTPLTAIKGFNELTAINNKDESIKKYIDGINRETSRMLALIGDMLKLSEFERFEKEQNINPVSVSLADIINDVRNTMSTAIDEKTISIKTNGDTLITAEQGHIYELVKNLIENAVRYNNQGGEVSITVKSTQKTAQLIISDNGIGISPEEQTRIFERFYRVEKSRSVKGGGTGLGLSIVKHICALYNWELSLKSKLGVGTEVTVIFK